LNILVTGGAGFIGSNLCTSLLDDGHRVTIIDNFSSGYKDNVDPRATLLEMDLVLHRDVWASKLDEIEPRIIFHLAAMPRIQPSIRQPGPTLDNNINSTLYILEYVRDRWELDIQLIYAGSSSYYGDPMNSPYAFSKHKGEELCTLFHRLYDCNVTIARFFNVYGPGQVSEGQFGTVIGLWEKAYRDNRVLEVTGDGSQSRDFTHVYDTIDGLKSIIGKPLGGTIYEFGTGNSYTLNELVELYQSDYCYIKERPGE